MPIAALRLLALVTATAVTLAAAAAAAEIPIYPGAKLDAAGMKFVRSGDPTNHDTYYLTRDPFEKVYAFYQRQPGATEEKALAGDNGAHGGMKLGVFQFKGGTVALTWPAPLATSVGLEASQATTRIAVDTAPSK